MTKAKKFLGMVMAALMCFALTPTAAFAADGDQGFDGTITITNAIPDETYTIYRILELESYNEDAKAYSYKTDAAWADFFNADAQVELGISVNSQNYVSWPNADSLSANAIAAFATRALDWATTHPAIKAAATQKATSTTVEFKNLDLGYYLLDSSMGTICSLDTTNSKISIKEKNDKPTIEKFIVEGTNDTLKDNDVSIGDTVDFKSVITCQPGTVDYIFTDTMSTGLTLDPASIKVSPNPDGTVITSDVEAGTIKITFDDAQIAAIAGDRDRPVADKQITITYSATLNDNAVVGTTGNDNKVVLDYKSDPNSDYRHDNDETTTYTWEFGVYKYFANGEKKADLAGAKFQLTDEDENVVSFTEKNGAYTVAKEGNLTTTLVSPENGRFKITGLDSGNYKLTETEAPAGYNKLAGSIDVTIVKGLDENDNVTVTIKPTDTDATLGIPTVQVENNTGLELPSTGGIGTMILYVVGGLLVLGAIVVLVRRRSSAK